MRILFLSQRLPYAPNRGDRIRAFHIIQALRRFADVSVASLVHDAEEASHVAEVRKLADPVIAAPVPRWANRLRAAARLPTSRPLTLELLHAPALRRELEDVVRRHPPDLVFAFCSSMARYAMEPPLRGVPMVLDLVDVDSAKWRALGRSAAPPLGLVYRREAHCLARFERDAIRAARVTVAVNRKEVDAARALAPGADVRVLENGIDLAAFRPSSEPAADPQVVFCGVMNYAPNEAAAVRLGTHIWPRVRRERPDARLVLVGASPTQKVRALASPAAGITVTGAVDDVKPALWQSAVAAMPLVTARGLQNKVLEALAAGLPAIVSPVVAEGLPASVLPGCVVAASDEEFADAILALLRATPAERRAIAGRAPLESLTWERQLASLPEIVREARER